MRLNQWLARAGAAASRRKADEIIQEGRVLVNGRLPELGLQIVPSDTVTVDGQVQALKPVSSQVLLINKPTGLVSSHKGQGGDKTVFSLLPPEYSDWKIIGRLDKDSEGLTVLSNDGDIVQAFGHPSAGHQKQYRVWLDRKLTQGDEWQLTSGVRLEEGVSKFERLQTGRDYIDVWLITGWNRQVRRTLESLGYRVNRLQRVELGPYRLGDLAVGEWRLEEAQR